MKFFDSVARAGPILTPALRGEDDFLCSSGVDTVCFDFVCQEVSDAWRADHCFSLGTGGCKWAVAMGPRLVEGGWGGLREARWDLCVLEGRKE